MRKIGLGWKLEGWVNADLMLWNHAERIGDHTD